MSAASIAQQTHRVTDFTVTFDELSPEDIQKVLAMGLEGATVENTDGMTVFYAEIKEEKQMMNPARLLMGLDYGYRNFPGYRGATCSF